MTEFYTKALMISKTNCPHCLNAEALLARNKIVIEKKMLGHDIARDELLEMVPHAKTVPQIWLSTESGVETYIGGYSDLKKLFEAVQ